MEEIAALKAKVAALEGTSLAGPEVAQRWPTWSFWSTK